MQALVLDRRREIALRDVPAPGACGPADVRIKIHTVGICGSDVHYYTHGRIGPYVVERPMVLGHEAAGTVVEIGERVTHLAVGDRVCMEPGIPDRDSRAAKLGIYNVDPAVRFWATPPVDGCLIEEVIHPAAFTFRLPDHLSFAEGAMVEPFAVGMQAATRAQLKPGDTVAVIGAGPIGLMVSLAALAGGAARVIIGDIATEKLAVARSYPGMIALDARAEPLPDRVADLTAGWGADVVFECSGSPGVLPDALAAARPGGAVVLVGIPVDPVPFEVAAAQAKELRIETIFRYAHMYPRAIDLMAAGRVDLMPLLTATYPFDEAVAAFERAAEARPSDVKLQITFAADGAQPA